MLNVNITLSHKTGACRSGSDKTGQVVHARVNGNWRAMCGTEPGRRADWSEHGNITLSYNEAMRNASKITCEKCKKALYKYSEKPQFGCDILHPF